MAKGNLIINVYADTIALPISAARVEITGNDIDTILITNEMGQTSSISLEAPDLKYSQVPQNEVKPFFEYTIKVSKAGFLDTIMTGVGIYPDQNAVQDVYLLTPDETSKKENIIHLDPPAIWNPIAVRFQDQEANGITTFVLPSVMVPDHIIVLDGAPGNTSAARYIVPFIDYIKNVTCSEIYSTWSEETIRANVHAIVSFTLNRVFTEWYRSRGYDFTITALPAYDQKYTRGRTIYESISKVVDDCFALYIRIGSRTHPHLAHYFAGQDGSHRPGWLSQWGSKTLGDQGYSALNIIRHFYGANTDIHTAPVHNNYLSSFPGYVLKLGSCGEPVLMIQNQLNIIRGNFPAIPIIPHANGIFDNNTVNAVRVFQGAFGLSVTGVVDFSTWYRISYYYIAVANLQRLQFGIS